MTDNGEINIKRTVAQDVSRVLLGAAAILIVPFVAMRFDSGVNWSPADFALMGALLVSFGLMYVAVVRNVIQAKYRAMVGAALVLAFMLIWAELAVGIFGSPFAGS